MSKVNICNIVVLNNPCDFSSHFQFEITFECLENLEEDLEWKIIYVGSAEDPSCDQVLDSVMVGPVPSGKHMFVFELTAGGTRISELNISKNFQTDAPNTALIPPADAVGVTVVLLTCSYRQQEFIRVGYFVNNEYLDPVLIETPPATPDFSKLTRSILATNPRVTRFTIDWGSDENTAPASVAGTSGQQQVEGMDTSADSNQQQKPSDASSMAEVAALSENIPSSAGAVAAPPPTAVA